MAFDFELGDPKDLDDVGELEFQLILLGRCNGHVDDLFLLASHV
jgi:hypothetical protein